MSANPYAYHSVQTPHRIRMRQLAHFDVVGFAVKNVKW